MSADEWLREHGRETANALMRVFMESEDEALRLRLYEAKMHLNQALFAAGLTRRVVLMGERE